MTQAIPETCPTCGGEATINPSALYSGEVQIVCTSETCDVHEVPKEIRQLTFDPTNFTTSSDGTSKWSNYADLEGTDCAPTEDKGNLGKQTLGETEASVWAWGHTLVGRDAKIGNLDIGTTRSSNINTDSVDRLQQEVTAHNVVSVIQKRVRKHPGFVVRDLVITLESGDTITLNLFGKDTADVTINANKRR